MSSYPETNGMPSAVPAQVTAAIIVVTLLSVIGTIVVAVLVYRTIVLYFKEIIGEHRTWYIYNLWNT
ncbi:hypothetical protein OPV22_016903 [Ensete ventricosum]|uniref:Uncharacterized protein n=1 Tax=Ensete ventricosum TaxID=4639 RepID=A0AAV8QV38_ENSVE|nr:hypothetical protein OPV22_016903 [Ensete ventricosum]